MHPNRPGRLLIVGLGPGSPGLLTPDASAALRAADAVVGYQGYLDLISGHLAGKIVIARDLGEEVERAQAALELAEQGHTVALVSSGDAGVYGMGGVAFELAAERGSMVEIHTIPGVTAALSAAACLGAPLAHDWACISLSDLLTPRAEILRRVDSAAQGDFVLALYNPSSRRRTDLLALAADRMLRHRGAETPVGIVESAYRPTQRVELTTLGGLARGSCGVNMFTTVIVGNSRTFVARGRMITPRVYAARARGPALTSRGDAEPDRADPGARIMAESMALIERELGPEPADTAERAIVRRMIHASADFDFASATRFGSGAVGAAISALQERAFIVTDVEMLRAGIRRDLADRLGVQVLCGLNDPEAMALAASASITRSAGGMRRMAATAGDRAIVAVGNAPTALDEVVRLVREQAWRPRCVIGMPVGFVGVVEAKWRLVEEAQVAWITCLGRKGGTAVAAAAVNALLELAGNGRAP